jgi:glycosyltransferase involved in cell wall biosynthesis
MPIDGKNWTGGYNYLLNLLKALAIHQKDAITPVLFVPAEDEANFKAFAALPGVDVVSSELFNASRRRTQLLQAILLGRAPALARLFAQRRIDVIFESAQFFGWRLGFPAIAWIPDFQHKALPHLFSRAAWWKREIGFRAQILGGRAILLSSDDARHDCERHYPQTCGRARVVRFAVPTCAVPDFPTARAIADGYGLPPNFIFMPNQFWRHKNHMLTLDALSVLRDRGIKIVVAASGKQHDPRAPGYFHVFERRLKDRGLEASLRLLGLIPYEHIHALMRCCQAMLNPSLFEGWSTTVEEARALATPMLLSDLEVHREQMGVDARYFRRDSAEALADLLQTVPSFDGSARELALDAARRDAEDRVRGFAADFTRLALDAAGARPA